MKHWLSLLCLIVGLLIILVVCIAFLAEVIIGSNPLSIIIVENAIESIWLIVFLVIGLIFITLWALLH